MTAKEARKLANEKQLVDNSQFVLDAIAVAAQHGKIRITVSNERMTATTKRKLLDLGYHVNQTRDTKKMVMDNDYDAGAAEWVVSW